MAPSPQPSVMVARVETTLAIGWNPPSAPPVVGPSQSGSSPGCFHSTSAWAATSSSPDGWSPAPKATTVPAANTNARAAMSAMSRERTTDSSFGIRRTDSLSGRADRVTECSAAVAVPSPRHTSRHRTRGGTRTPLRRRSGNAVGGDRWGSHEPHRETKRNGRNGPHEHESPTTEGSRRCRVGGRGGGGQGRGRTADLRFFRPALYQLSYLTGAAAEDGASAGGDDGI